MSEQPRRRRRQQNAEAETVQSTLGFLQKAGSSQVAVDFRTAYSQDITSDCQVTCEVVETAVGKKVRIANGEIVFAKRYHEIEKESQDFWDWILQDKVIFHNPIPMSVENANDDLGVVIVADYSNRMVEYYQHIEQWCHDIFGRLNDIIINGKYGNLLIDYCRIIKEMREDDIVEFSVAEAKRFTNYYTETFQKYNSECNDLWIDKMERYKTRMNESIRIRRAGTRTVLSGVYVAAPSLAAIVANEEMHASIKAKAQSQWNTADAIEMDETEEFILLFRRIGQGLAENFIHGSRDLVEKCKKGLAKRLIHIEGKAAFCDEWLRFQEKPTDPNTYVQLLFSCQSIIGIAALVEEFHVSKEEIYKKCVEKLKEMFSQSNIDQQIVENQIIFHNMAEFFDLPKDSIIREALSSYAADIAERLSLCSMKLPQEAKKSYDSSDEVSQMATLLVEAIILPIDFQYIQNEFGREWIQLLNKVCGIDVQSNEPYEAIIDLVYSRIVEVHNCLIEQIRVIKKLKKEMAKAKQELKDTSFFAFSKKKQLIQYISELEEKIDTTHITYNKRIQEM